MKHNNKRYSLAKLAAELNVSKATISLVMNGKARSGGISVELENKIKKFCSKVNYKPNIHAQRINSKQVKNIVVLLEETSGIDEETPLGEYNISHILGGIAKEAAAAGYRFSIQLYQRGMSLAKVMDWFHSREIDGLIYYGFDIPNAWKELFIKEKINIVGISIDPRQGIPCVNIDNYEASYKLTKHLIDKGYSRFLYLGGSKGSYPGKQRYLGFCNALKDNSIRLDKDCFLCADFDLDIAEDFVRQRWTSGKLLENAIVCANDNMALGVIRALKDAAVSIPKQIAVVGADNIKLGSFIEPSLTTFDFLPLEQGKAAFKLLYHIIYKNDVPENILLRSSLHFRSSG
jgi:LacI family transcriptional regulator